MIYDREGTIEELEGKLETVNKEVSAMAEDLHAHKVAAKSSEVFLLPLFYLFSSYGFHFIILLFSFLLRFTDITIRSPSSH